MGFKRYAEAVWQGDLQAGKGAMSTPQSGLFAGQNYSFKTRFGDEKGTNPEELLAAAHAGCFSMALSAVLGKSGFTRTGSKRGPRRRWSRAWIRDRPSPA
jgi:osmotically inducible protein OsmC